MVSNISERKALMENLRMLAEHDGLTGLYNRTYFHGELERVVERVHRSEVANCALLYIDLDHFKYVNDTLGHAAGDKLLIEVANILTRRARKSDLVARLGGDEFTVLMYDTKLEQLEKVADSFRRQLADFNFNYEGQTVAIGCSIGVAVIEPSAQSPAEVMSRADLACHIAKRAGRNQVHLFAPDDAKDVTSMSLDMGWSRRIREAVEHNRFALACQPIVSTRNRATRIYEVLIRMLDDNGGLIMPGGFLSTAERFGLSLDIDRWVITNAIEILAEQRVTQPELCYSINLSAQTLNTPAICILIQDKLRATGLDPAALIFEVTETAAISDLNAAAALLARLRALGCRTALDDFGSGMSSFAYLKELPVDIVKIDGRFVKHIATSAVDKAMVRAMNDIAHALGKETIAEFVEDEAAFQILIELGVDYGQGYHLGRPDLVAPCSAIAAHAGVAGACRI
jgi:diguanylate cyclase (GGDEF)-like protein